MEYPNNVAYGTTEDGETFVVEQKGAGRAGGQAARLASLFFFLSPGTSKPPRIDILNQSRADR